MLDDRNAGNTYLTAASLLRAFRYPETRAAHGPTFTPAHFLDGAPHTLYVVAPDHEQGMLAPLVVAIISSIVHAAAERAQTAGPIDPTVRMLLDEIANIAPLRALPKYLSQASAYGLRIATVWQSLGQMHEHFGAASDSILANSAVKAFMGPVSDDRTRAYLVDLLGDEPSQSTSTSSDTMSGQLRTRTVSEARRPMATSASLQQLRQGRAIVFDGNLKPYMTRVDVGGWERHNG